VPVTVLIVDDHPSFRRLARKLFEAAGYVVVGDAADGAGAIEAAARLRPDVVLLDVLLPDQSGFDVAIALAAEPEPPEVVLTSSRSASDLRPSLDAAAAVGFIPKDELSTSTLAVLFGAGS
jgi:DNA-binding NarL/FixJ family response regulator